MWRRNGAAFGRKVDLASSTLLAYCALTFASLIIFIQNQRVPNYSGHFAVIQSEFLLIFRRANLCLV